MFRFVITWLGFLKHVPLLAWVADAFLLTGTSLFNRPILRAIDRIELEVSRWNGITVTIHKYGGLQFNYLGHEIGHLHSNGILDVLFCRKTKAKLLADGVANEHHTLRRSGWVSFYIKDVTDTENGISLLKLAYNIRLQKIGIGLEGLPR